jgi:hypothetical protein
LEDEQKTRRVTDLPTLCCFNDPISATAAQVENDRRWFRELVHCQILAAANEEHMVPMITDKILEQSSIRYNKDSSLIPHGRRILQGIWHLSTFPKTFPLGEELLLDILRDWFLLHFFTVSRL